MSRWWYILMSAGGFAFGLFANKRPFGNGILLHPLVLYFVTVAVALLVLRFVAARPVPEIITDRALVYGCTAGLTMFLVANFIAAHAIGLR